MSYSAKVTFTLTSVHILQKPFADLIIGGGGRKPKYKCLLRKTMNVTNSLVLWLIPGHYGSS